MSTLAEATPCCLKKDPLLKLKVPRLSAEVDDYSGRPEVRSPEQYKLKEGLLSKLLCGPKTYFHSIFTQVTHPETPQT